MKEPAWSGCVSSAEPQLATVPAYISTRSADPCYHHGRSTLQSIRDIHVSALCIWSASPVAAASNAGELKTADSGRAACMHRPCSQLLVSPYA